MADHHDSNNTVALRQEDSDDVGHHHLVEDDDDDDDYDEMGTDGDEFYEDDDSEYLDSDDFDDDGDREDEELEEEYDVAEGDDEGAEPVPPMTSSTVSLEEAAAANENGAADMALEDASEGAWDPIETDGLCCPICMEAWTTGGDHQTCCLPCGHIYGLSCIKRWFQQCQNSGKCPQCNRRCILKDVRVLYASRIVAADEELQKITHQKDELEKKVRFLEASCASLKDLVEVINKELFNKLFDERIMKMIQDGIIMPGPRLQSGIVPTVGDSQGGENIVGSNVPSTRDEEEDDDDGVDGSAG